MTIVYLLALPPHSRPPDTMLFSGDVLGLLVMVMHSKVQPGGPFSSTQVQNWQPVLSLHLALQADQLFTFGIVAAFSRSLVLVLTFKQPKQTTNHLFTQRQKHMISTIKWQNSKNIIFSTAKKYENIV